MGATNLSMGRPPKPYLDTLVYSIINTVKVIMWRRKIKYNSSLTVWIFIQLKKKINRVINHNETQSKEWAILELDEGVGKG